MLAMLAFYWLASLGGDMANLMVRNVDDAVVKALKARAGRDGISAEAEHRKILEEVLLKPKKKSFVDVLMVIPDVGRDEDFTRTQERSAKDVFN
jgi:antitoxin FitA